MNEMRGARTQVHPLIAEHHNQSQHVVKRSLDGQRRLEPTGPEARVQARREARVREDKKILDGVRLAIVHGVWEEMTAEKLEADTKYLRARGYTDSDMTTPVVFDMPLMPMIRRKFQS